MADNTNFERLKNEYAILKSKYSLPNFRDLEEEFDIGKTFEKDCETNFILRDIRKAVNEKLSAYLHLFETFMNPSSAPLFVLTMIKNLNEDDRKLIKEIHGKIVKMTIIVMKLDTIYSESAEAEFINYAMNSWASLKKEIYSIIEKLEDKSGGEIGKTSKGYFG